MIWICFFGNKVDPLKITECRAILGSCVCLLLLIAEPVQPVYAEWYVAAFGGLGTDAKLRNPELPTLARTLVSADPNFQIGTTPNAFVEQSLDTSNIELKDTVTYGTKIGHFFDEMDLPWFGVELEAFTTTPDVKQQTVSTKLSVRRFAPAPLPQNDTIVQDCESLGPGVCPDPGIFQIQKSSLRVTTLAVNLIARYPSDIVQPYVGLGLGGFWFHVKDQLKGSIIVPGINALAGIKVKITEELSIFAEGKWNRATADGLGPTLGAKADYEIFHWVGGVGFAF